jgi:hypothetical protein
LQSLRCTLGPSKRSITSSHQTVELARSTCPQRDRAVMTSEWFEFGYPIADQRGTTAMTSTSNIMYGHANADT